MLQGQLGGHHLQVSGLHEGQQANALNRLFFNGAYIVGAPLGGILVATVGPGWGIGVDAAAFALSAVAFAFVRIPAAAAPAVAPARTGILADLRGGWTEFRSRTWLWVVVAGFSLINACLSAGMSVLGPVVADDTVGRRAWGFACAPAPRNRRGNAPTPGRGAAAPADTPAGRQPHSRTARGAARSHSRSAEGREGREGAV